MPQIKIGESRYIQGRDTGARPAFKVGAENWELTTDIGLTKGSPVLRIGGDKYIREYFGAPFTINIEMSSYAWGAENPPDISQLGIKQNIYMYISEVKVYNSDNAILGSAVITSNFRDNNSAGDNGVDVIANNNVANVKDGNTSTYIGLSIEAEADEFDASSAKGLGSVVVSDNSNMATKIEIYYGHAGTGDCCHATSDGVGYGNTIVEGFVQTLLNGTQVSYKSFDDNDSGGDSEGISRFKLTFDWNGSSWIMTDTAW